VICISALSTLPGFRNDPAVLVDPETANSFWTSNQTNSWISIDLIERKVLLTGYSLKSHLDSGNGHIKQWSL
jgi:hypothetical protein